MLLLLRKVISATVLARVCRMTCSSQMSAHISLSLLNSRVRAICPIYHLVSFGGAYIDSKFAAKNLVATGDDFPPVVRIWVAGVSFPSRNERLEQRLSGGLSNKASLFTDAAKFFSFNFSTKACQTLGTGSIWSLIKDLPIQAFLWCF